MTEDEKLEQEYQDSLKPDGSGESKETDDDADAGDDSVTEPQSEEQIAEELNKLKSTNAKLYARAKNAEKALKEGRKDASEEQIKPEPESDADWKQKIEFVIKHKDLDEDQIDYVSAFAKGKGVTLKEALENKLVLAAIESDRKEKKIANATPDGKSNSPATTSFVKKISEANTRDEHKKLWEQASQGNPKGVQVE